MEAEKHIHLIIGPTAVGKTERAIEIAQSYNCEIISTDSRQVYKELIIGVARPDEEQLGKVKHHMIACVSIQEEYNAGKFATDAGNIINRLFETSDHVVLCGGTGLYIKALIDGLDPLPAKNEKRRRELQMIMDVSGVEALAQILLDLDPERHNNIDKQNPQRLIRAIEIAESDELSEPITFKFKFPFHLHIETLEMDRDKLYSRINQRVDKMINEGLENEVKSLLPHMHLNALQTVGYSEWLPYFEDKTSREEVIDKIKQHSRNYAKRQVTWFKNQTYLGKKQTSVLSVEQTILAL